MTYHLFATLNFVDDAEEDINLTQQLTKDELVTWIFEYLNRPDISSCVFSVVKSHYNVLKEMS